MKTRLRQRFPSTPILLLSLFIAAMGLSCGGGGGSTPPPPTDQDAQGLYTTNGSGSGTFKNADPSKPDVVEPLKNIKGMVYGALPNQMFIFFDVGTNVLYEGNIQSIKLTSFTGTATVYHDGVVVEDGVTTGTAAKVIVHGSIISRSNIDMTLDPSGNFKGGSIKGLFSSEYDKAATNARIFADGTLANPNFKGFVLMAIPNMFVDDFEGFQGTYSFISVRSGPTSQCNHSGNAKSNKVKNIYVLSLGTVIANTNCTITLTNYTGFASVVDGVGTDTRVWYAVTNGSNSIFAVLNKQ